MSREHDSPLGGAGEISAYVDPPPPVMVTITVDPWILDAPPEWAHEYIGGKILRAVFRETYPNGRAEQPSEVQSG